MPWSESWISSDDYLYNATSENKIDKSDVQNDKVDNTTAFLLNFEWNQQNIIKGCITDIQDDVQLKNWLNELLKSKGSNDFINKIKHELKDGIVWGLDDETLEFLVISIIAESIEEYKINFETSSDKELNSNKNLPERGVMDNVNIRESKESSIVNIINKLDENAESFRNMRNVLEERAKLVHKYENLDELTNVNSDKYRDIKFQLEQSWTLNQLKKEHDEQFINDYILAQATLQELKSNPTNYEEADISFFDKLVKNLNNSCNIPDTNLSSFSSENLTQTRIELFHPEIWNDSLIKVKNQNMESRDYSNVFPEMWDDEIISNYGNFLEWGLKEFCQRYQNNSELKSRMENINGNPSTDEERILLQNYKTMMLELKRIKEETENKTKNLMEELSILSLIKWMSMCIWQENWKDFNLNKAREIQNDNWILTLNGHIDWVDFSVRHDTNKENSHLETSSKLGYTSDKNTFMIWLEGQYTSSSFIMPSQKEIFSVILDEFQSDSNDLKKYDDINSYFENLQQNIMWRMDKVYEKAKYAQHYIRNKVKWEKVVDSSLYLLRRIKPGIDADLSKPINQVNSGQLYDFIKMLNFNIENSTDIEKDKLNRCIFRILEIIDNYKNTRWNVGFDTVNYPPIIENYLKNQTWLDNWNENSKLWLIFDMLSYYNLNSMDSRTNIEWNQWISSKVIINYLYRDLFEFSGGESEVCVKRKNENNEKQDKQEADELLKWIENM